jgi:NAD(P)-dependent dehydrogenase (short-subunit alcohol dehydrogenase family)
VRQAIAAAVGHFGRLDLLVNNAGATKRADFCTLPEEDWDRRRLAQKKTGRTDSP